MFTLLYWIAGCVGPDCEIPDYEVRHFDTLEQCDKVAEILKTVEDKDNQAYCLDGKIEHKGHPDWNVNDDAS